jgi:plastocyanin
MKKILSITLIIAAFLPFVVFHSYAQNTTSTFHKDVDVSPIEGVIMINEDQNKSAFFQPSSIIVRVGGEILVANNSTSDHSVTSGSGPDDPMSGKLFNTDILNQKDLWNTLPKTYHQVIIPSTLKSTRK